MIRIITLIPVFVILAGCAGIGAPDVETVVVREDMAELDKEPVPGAVREVWVEPMYDTVRVPAQLDPSGNYFRPSHRTIYEIRPGKHQLVEFPPDNSRGESSENNR